MARDPDARVISIHLDFHVDNMFTNEYGLWPLRGRGFKTYLRAAGRDFISTMAKYI